MAKRKDELLHEVVFHEYPKLIYIWPIILLGILFWFPGEQRMVPDPNQIAAKAIADAGGKAAANVRANADKTEADNPGNSPTPSETNPDSTDGNAATKGETNAEEAAIPMEVPVDGEQEILGWIYLITIFIVILTVGVDVERNYAFFWVAIISVFWLACWLLQEKDFPVFSHIYNAFADMNVSYNRSFGLSLSFFLAIPYVTMCLWARMNNKWRITHNEFEHYSWGRADDSLARGAKRVRSTYPDIFEFLLLGGGTLIVYSATGRSELKRIHNVPMLFLVRKKINRVLESTRVNVDHTHAEEVLADESDDEDTARSEEGAEGEIGNEKL